MPLLDTDGWWRKHAVTTTATMVEVGIPKGGSESAWQQVVADVLDPDTGEVVRVKSKQLITTSPWRVGDVARVRYSSKQKNFRRWNRWTVPQDEWLQDANEGGPQQVTVVSAGGADASSALGSLESLRAQGAINDAQLDGVRSALASLGLGATAGAESASPPQPDPAAASPKARLAKLQGLLDAGLIDADEYARQRERILDSI